MEKEFSQSIESIKEMDKKISEIYRVLKAVSQRSLSTEKEFKEFREISEKNQKLNISGIKLSYKELGDRIQFLEEDLERLSKKVLSLGGE